MLNHFTVSIFFKSIYLIKGQVLLNSLPHSPAQVMAFPPSKAHELESKLPLITLYS